MAVRRGGGLSPLGQKLASTWLREKAMDLRTAASRADKAYSTGGGYEAARYCAPTRATGHKPNPSKIDWH